MPLPGRKSVAVMLWVLLPAIVVFLAVGIPQLLTESDQTLPSPASGVTKARVQRIFPGWREGDLSLRARGAPWRGALVTVLLRNFDRWLIDQAYIDPALLGTGMTPEDLTFFDRANISEKAREEATRDHPERYQAVNNKFQQWYRHQLGELRLMVAGQVFGTIKPFDSTLRVTTNKEDTWSQVVFCVEPGPEEKARWQELIRTVGTSCSAPVTLALKVGNEYRWMLTEVNSAGDSPQRYDLPLRPWLMRAVAWAALTLVASTVWRVGCATPAMRSTRDPKLPAEAQAPWSLARVVLAWWLTICAGCFLFLWAMTDEFNNLSGSAPLLLGINGTTLLFAAALGSRSSSAQPEPAHPDAAGVIASPVPPTSPPAAASAGFFEDLISEAGEPEVSRLQMLVWNVVLGIVFIWQTLAQWKMPEFNATLMTLLGISSTAYVGFKFVPGPK